MTSRIHEIMTARDESRCGVGRRYEKTFRTFPAQQVPVPVRFAVIGDFGIGIFEQEGAGVRQLRIAHALERAVAASDARLVLTTGATPFCAGPGHGSRRS